MAEASVDFAASTVRQDLLLPSPKTPRFLLLSAVNAVTRHGRRCRRGAAGPGASAINAVRARKVLLATGSTPYLPSSIPFDGYVGREALPSPPLFATTTTTNPPRLSQVPHLRQRHHQRPDLSSAVGGHHRLRDHRARVRSDGRCRCCRRRSAHHPTAGTPKSSATSAPPSPSSCGTACRCAPFARSASTRTWQRAC